MLVQSSVDMSRPTTLYATGLGIIMLVSLIASNIPALALSTYYEFALRRELCAGLFIFGSIAGALALQRHVARSKEPWRVPQSQVSFAYLAFFVTTLAAVVLSR